jgi:hypothetical protein
MALNVNFTIIEHNLYFMVHRIVLKYEKIWSSRTLNIIRKPRKSLFSERKLSLVYFVLSNNPSLCGVKKILKPIKIFFFIFLHIGIYFMCTHIYATILCEHLMVCNQRHTGQCLVGRTSNIFMNNWPTHRPGGGCSILF